MSAARADGSTDTLELPNTSLLKAGNWSSGDVPVQGVIGEIGQAGSAGPLGWNNNTNPGTTNFGAIDLISGATDEIIGNYTTKSANTAVTINLQGATLNNIANTVIANSSGSTVVFENDVAPSGDDLAETGLTSFSLGNTTNVIQATANSNIIIDHVITGTGASLTFLGSGSSAANGATLELGAGSVNDVVGGVAANAPVPANAGTFSGVTAVQQTADKNSFTGGLTVGNADGTQAGIVQADGANALPTTGTVTVNTNSQLLLKGSSTYGGTTQNLVLNGTGTGGTGNGALSTGNNDVSTWQGTTNLATNSSVNVSGTSGSLTVTGAVGGTGQLQKVGSGRLNLNQANSYSGGTVVTAGSLAVGNSTALGSGDVSVAGGDLSSSVATASVGGDLSLGSGSIALNAAVAPTLQLALNQSFTMSGGTLSLTVASGTTGSIGSLGGTGSFSITGGTLDLTDSFTNYSVSYDILNGFATGSVSGLTISDYDTTDYTAHLSDDGVLSFTDNSSGAVPEPSTDALMILGAGFLLVWRLRRTRQDSLQAGSL